MSDTGTGGADFDFLHGSWAVRHRKLRHRLMRDDVWTEFDGTMTARPILAGAGNFDENVLHHPAGTYQACTIRMFDPATAQWRIFWIDGRDPAPQPPVIGGFQSGVGKFLGHDVLDGRPILVRFTWSDITADSARWEQSFSDDDGASWESNWVMTFRRVGR